MVYGYMSSATGNKQQIYVQKKAIKQYCKENGLVWHMMFIDTGSSLKIRKELQMMIDMLKEGDTVVVKDYSRLTRNMFMLYDVVNITQEKGAELKIIEQDIDDMDVLLYNEEIRKIAQKVLNHLK